MILYVYANILLFFSSFFLQTYPGSSRKEKFIKRFLMKEVTNQISSLIVPMESASEGMDEQAKEERFDRLIVT